MTEIGRPRSLCEPERKEVKKMPLFIPSLKLRIIEKNGSDY